MAADSDYERGYNMGYYLHQYAPHILDRALKNMKGQPEEFLRGLKEGSAKSKEERKSEEREKRRLEEIEDRETRAKEKEMERAHEDGIKRKEREKRENAERTDQELQKEYMTDHVQKRLEELNEMRGRESPALEKETEAPTIELPQTDETDKEKTMGDGQELNTTEQEREAELGELRDQPEEADRTR